MPLLDLICFQTRALLTLLILEKLRGHQRKGVRARDERLWFEGMGVSLFMWYWCPKVWWKCFITLPGKIWGGNAAFRQRKMPRAAVQHKAKCWCIFWSQGIPGAWQTCGLLTQDEMIFVVGWSKRGSSEGCQRLLWALPRMWWGKAAQAESRDTAPGTKVPFYTRANPISSLW